MEPVKIVVVGSLNVDLVVRTPRVPEDGETIVGTEFDRFFGGKGANQAVAARRQGAETIMAGRVGSDLFGQDQVRSLKEQGISTAGIIIDETHPTGTASIILDEQGNNRIIVVPGANGAYSPEDVEGIRHLIAEADAVVVQLEIPLEAVERVLTVAREMGKLTVLNPAPAAALPDDLYRYVAVITPNESEATLLTGVQVLDAASARQAAEKLRAKGVDQVIITLGSKGVYGLDKQEEFHIPAHQVNVVDTVAAGDTFTGALAVMLAEGKSLAEAAQYANAAAAIAVTRPGAQPSVPTRSEVLAFLKES
ncbi:MAG: ribokinase [Firmicutes bacterium]|jgi:ribokinase|nr:ribokinase [Bacillota bacterium]